MKWYSWVSMVVVCASCSAAQGGGAVPSLADQFNAVDSMMQGTSGDPSSYFTTYASRMMEGLSGTWTTIGLLHYTQDNPELLHKACEKQPINVEIDGLFVVKMTYYSGSDKQFTSNYTSTGGNLFAVSTLPAQILHRMGLDQGDAPVDASLRALSSTNGTATMLRPSHDILIVQTNLGYPSVLGRCPSRQ